MQKLKDLGEGVFAEALSDLLVPFVLLAAVISGLADWLRPHRH